MYNSYTATLFQVVAQYSMNIKRLFSTWTLAWLLYVQKRTPDWLIIDYWIHFSVLFSIFYEIWKLQSVKGKKSETSPKLIQDLIKNISLYKMHKMILFRVKKRSLKSLNSFFVVDFFPLFAFISFTFWRKSWVEQLQCFSYKNRNCNFLNVFLKNKYRRLEWLGENCWELAFPF